MKVTSHDDRYRESRWGCSRAHIFDPARWGESLEELRLWETLNRLHAKGFVSNPVRKTKSIVLTAEGLGAS
jgi:hypothetical protein